MLLRLWTVLLLGAAVTWAQGQKTAKGEGKPKKPTAGEIEIGDPGVKIEDASVARQQVVRFQKEWKAARKDVAKRIELLKRLGKWDHPLVLAEAKKRIKDRHHLVAVEAVRVCAKQASEKKKTASALLGALKREKRTHVVCALLVGMGVLGYDHPNAKKAVLKYFRKNTKETHKAATRYLGYIKDKESFRILALRLDYPRPADPTSPNNPPASYWKARWEEWDSNVPWTRWAISQLVPGETFDNRAEAEDWARSEGKKHGIKW